MLILYVMSWRFCLYLLHIYHFTYIFSHAYSEAHTHKHTCIFSTQEEWRQLDTAAWSRLRVVEERTTTRQNILVTVESGGRKAFIRDQGLTLMQKGKKCLKRLISFLISKKDSSTQRFQQSYQTISYEVQPIPPGVAFSNVFFQGSKLENQICHVSVIRDIRALSFEFWKSFQKCHPMWNWL